MTTSEFSNEFDVLLNSFYTQGVFGETSSKSELVLDEYEKSVLLTQAQEEIVKELYSGKFNGESFEKTEELRRSLSSLIKTIKPRLLGYEGNIKIDNTSIFYEYPDDVWFILYEQATITDTSLCNGESIVKVVPVRYDEWQFIKNNPFKKPNKNKVVRLDKSSRILELISQYPITDYIITYLEIPLPIILTDLPKELSINDYYEEMGCSLNSALHRTILERAVQLAYKRFPQASK